MAADIYGFINFYTRYLKFSISFYYNISSFRVIQGFPIIPKSTRKISTTGDFNLEVYSRTNRLLLVIPNFWNVVLFIFSYSKALGHVTI